MARRIPLTSKILISMYKTIADKVAIMYFNYMKKKPTQKELKIMLKAYVEKVIEDLLNTHVVTIGNYKLEIIKFNKKKVKSTHYRHDNKFLYHHDSTYRYTILLTSDRTYVNWFYPVITDDFAKRIIECLNSGIEYREIEYEEYCKYKISN